MEVSVRVGSPVFIGRAGENLATTVRFDLSKWASEIATFNIGNVSLWIKQGTNFYTPRDGISKEGTTLKWLVTNTTTQFAGPGQCELRYTDKDTNLVKKSVSYDFIVGESLDGEAGDAPAPGQDWVIEVQSVAEEVRQARDTLLKMTASATELEEGKSPTAEWTINEEGNKKLVLGIPKGATGPQGTSILSVEQTKTSTANKGKNEITVTLSDGTTSILKVQNGSQGTQGVKGERGVGIYSVTSAPSSYATPVGDFTPAFRIEIETVKSQSGAEEVLIGDQIRYDYYLYPVKALDDTYAYTGPKVSIRGASGTRGVGIYTSTTEPSIYEGEWQGVFNPLSILKTDFGKDNPDVVVQVGDCIRVGTDLYQVYSIGATLIFLDNPTSLKGDKGDRFTITKVYASVDDMNADHSNPDVPVGSFVAIQSADGAEHEDNAKLYLKTETGFDFKVDLSGAQGIQGPAATISEASCSYEGEVAGDGKPGVEVVSGGTSSDRSFTFKFRNLKGEKGDPGKNFTIIDYYSTFEELEAAITNPETGDVYGVGESEPYDIYVYSASDKWVNNGPIGGGSGASSNGDNLIRNWDFTNPVNSRGLTEYPIAVSNSFGIDGWRIRNNTGTLTLEEDGIRITNTGSKAIFMDQHLDITELKDNDVVLSLLVSEVVGTCYTQLVLEGGTGPAGGELSPGLHVIKKANTYTDPDTKIKERLNVKTALIQINAGSSLKIKAIKAEIGDNQTLAHQDAEGKWVLNEHSDYNKECLRCYISSAYASAIGNEDEYANSDLITVLFKTMNGIANHYSENITQNADELMEGFALVSMSESENAELMSLIGGTYAYIQTWFYRNKGIENSRLQIAASYGASNPKMAYRVYNNSVSSWSTWKRLATTDYALPRDGSAAMTGNLYIERSTFPTIGIQDTTLSRSGLVQLGANGAVGIYAFKDTNNKSMMVLNPESVNDANLLYVQKVSDGVFSDAYKVYHTGNKPTSEDIGAAAASHDHDAGDIKSGTLSISRGGTGKTTEKTALNAFIGGLDDGTSGGGNWIDSMHFVRENLAVDGTYYRATLGDLWKYINKKDTSVAFAECDTAADVADKVVACSGFVLTGGARICVRFANTNSVESPTLNVNGTGAKTVVYRGNALTSSTANYLYTKRMLEFMYDKTNDVYELISTVDTNTNTYVTQNVSTTNAEYPLLASYTANKANSSATSARFKTDVTLNTSTGTITAPYFKGAAPAGTDYTTARVRSIYATTTDLVAETTSLTNGTIALVYE